MTALHELPTYDLDHVTDIDDVCRILTELGAALNTVTCSLCTG